VAEIRLDALAKRYGRTEAVAPTDLTIAEGEFFAILGPSGSGKTTLLRMIGGFVEPSGGRIAIGGRDVTREPPHRRNLGVVFQSYALFPHMTARENVAFGLRMRGAPWRDRSERAEDALAMVGLEGLGDRWPAQLSGGQQQRVALARALVIEPDALLLDEPLGALDLALRRRMQRELADLRRRLGKTFVYVTHDQEEALTLADRVAVMEGGRLRQVAPPRALYEHPATAFVAGFVGDSNILTGEVRRAEGGRATLSLADGLGIGLPDGAPEGRAAVSIRPERVRLGPAGGEGLPATVAGSAFKGPWIAVRLSLGAGLALEALAPNDGGPPPEEGQSVTARIDPADVRLIGDRA
jgi:ABC-type Fe3+/spermidine/putrescine transport system ATPase subunit